MNGPSRALEGVVTVLEHAKIAEERARARDRRREQHLTAYASAIREKKAKQKAEKERQAHFHQAEAEYQEDLKDPHSIVAIKRAAHVRREASSALRPININTWINARTAGGVRSIKDHHCATSGRGFDANARFAFGLTALHRAAAHGENATVRYLVMECGANVDARDTSGKKPADYAHALGFEETASLLSGGLQAELKDRSRREAMPAERKSLRGVALAVKSAVRLRSMR
jgi:hypothetical protein